MKRKLNLYHNLMDQVINEPSDTLAEISLELAQTCRMAIQNRVMDDFCWQHGVHALVGDECCTYISDSSDLVTGHLNKIKELQRGTSKMGDRIHSHGWAP